MSAPVELNAQAAPWPDTLAELVAVCRYRPGWTVDLGMLDRGQGSMGLTLTIRTAGYDAYHPERGETYNVLHYFPVPPASYDARSWQRWLFEQFALVERHEAMEFFRFTEVGDFINSHGARVAEATRRPYAPSHGPGNDPYLLREVGTALDARTSFRGRVNPA